VERLKPARVVETYSGGVKLAMVARGDADLYANTYTNFHDWDICAGQILVEEAGGRVGPFPGPQGIAVRAPVIASAAGIADELGALVQTVACGER
jgi:fructose-1,6-bisphosphatase/inositol monophosphatase family enzyme